MKRSEVLSLSITIIILVAIIIISGNRKVKDVSMAGWLPDPFSTSYTWTDSIGISTTEQDSHFVVQWENVRIWSNGCDLLARIGAPDTTSWDSRSFIKYPAGQVFGFDSGTKLKRLEYKAASGTGSIFFVGDKKSSQY